jgi:hypothetical protein
MASIKTPEEIKHERRRSGQAMSAFGTKRICQSRSAMSAFGGKADIAISERHVCF